MFYVYVLRSESDCGFYIGSSTNLRARLRQHQDGKSLATSHRGPWKFIYYEAYEGRKSRKIRLTLAEKKMTINLGTAAVYVSDQKPAEEFWTQKVGFELAAKKKMGPDAYWLEVKPKGAESALVLYPRSAMKGWEEMKPSIVFQCDNFDKTFEQLRVNGDDVGEPMDLPWGKFLEFRDPDGNEFGVRGVMS